MFREMRRDMQRLSERECVEILERNTSGVLALQGVEHLSGKQAKERIRQQEES